MTPRDSEYWQHGFVLIERIVSPEVATGMLARMKSDFARQGIDIMQMTKEGPLLARPAVEIYGFHYPIFASFHWGLTPLVEAKIGTPLLPSYCYFRMYRQGDICRVHGDRPACEHSVSLTLGYSDGATWPLEVARGPIDQPYERRDTAFSPGEDPVPTAMKVGDGVLYRGVHHHHGRTTPNPNRWSAHLFLHWVDPQGPFADQAFDRNRVPTAVDF